MKKNDDIVMYLLMRDDIPSMNPGKLAAQASHVSNSCVYNIRNSRFSKLKTMLSQWEKQTNNGFGTAICLAVKEYQIEEWSNWHGPDALYGVVEEPSYPCYIPTEIANHIYHWDEIPSLNKNGFEVIVKPDNSNSIFLRPEVVGAYLFGDKNDPNIQKIVKELKLYP